ncbi:MAG: polymerase subunit chi, partial [Novosphingobium sp.]|nr:polymerase subunit chi [Novosphingobium sp.]
MRVDFYQLSRDPAEAALPLIARATLQAGERLLVVSADEAQLGRIDELLWTRLPDAFLAHGLAGGEHDARQPILLSAETAPTNEAKYLALADG